MQMLQLVDANIIEFQELPMCHAKPEVLLCSNYSENVGIPRLTNIALARYHNSKLRNNIL